MNYGPAAKNSYLTSVLWYNDSAGKMEDGKDANIGLVQRRKFLSATKSSLTSHLHCDVFNQEKLLINGVEVRVRLVRSRDSFGLMDPTGCYSVHIDEANLLVRRLKISQGVLLAHAQSLSKTTTKYPLTRVEVKAVTMHTGIHGETLDNIILDQLPKRIIIGFVNNKAFNGDRALNSFNFEHFNINFLCLYVDGVQVPSKPLQPNFGGSNLYIDAYHTLFSGTGVHFLNEGNEISRESCR